MDISYEEAVSTWLVADGRTLIAPQYPVRIGEATRSKPVRWPDILAVRPKDRQIFLCEVTWSKDWSRLCRKIDEYHDRLDDIRTSLDHWLGIGCAEWQVSVWYFVPEAHVDKIGSRRPYDGSFLKVTPLESIKPWTYAWGFREA